jgi:hypothetical protein
VSTAPDVEPLAEDLAQDSTPRAVFEPIDESAYMLSFPSLGIEFTLDHLHRERSQLIGELAVRCNLAGARTVDGVLSVGDFNLSSVPARGTRAKYLDELAQTDGLDWRAMLEQLAQRVLIAERAGQPAVLLAELPRPAPDAVEVVDGIPILARHPMIFFGDGDSAKSFLMLYIAGMLAFRGRRVAFFDWELDGGDHRERLEMLFGAEMPRIAYKRCDRPLSLMTESIRRTVRDHEIEFGFFDSIGFACDGPPEAAEVAGRYLQAVRQLGPIGTAHAAHVSKSAEGADLKPFGSAFWHNGPRSTWNVKRAESAPGDATVSIALHHRKSNTARRSPSVGFELLFEEDRTVIRRVDPAGVPELAGGVSLAQRLRSFVRTPRTRDEIAAELDTVKPDTLKRTINRALKSRTLIRFPGPVERIGLPYRGEP